MAHKKIVVAGAGGHAKVLADLIAAGGRFRLLGATDSRPYGAAAILGGAVRLAPGAIVGLGAVVNPGLKIGARAVVGAGAVVVKDVRLGAVVVGVPARETRRPA